MAGIKLKNIQKTYAVEDRKIDVLKGINLEIPDRSITVVLGRSGCGKTTLLRLVGGLEEADYGDIEYDMVHKNAFVFQESRLMPWLNVRDNVKFGMKKKCDNSIIQSMIDTVGLNGFEKAYPAQLSGGMQQRVAIARALAYKPSFVMMDEPFAALDYFTRTQMQKEVIRLQKEQGVSIFFVTHSIDEALLLGHKIIVVEKGVIKTEFIIEQDNEERNLLTPEFIKLKKRLVEAIDL